MKKKYTDKNVKLDVLYEYLRDIMFKSVIRFNDRQMVASTMLDLALRLYKSTLTKEEYSEMLQVVNKHAKEIKPFNQRVLH